MTIRATVSTMSAPSSMPLPTPNPYAPTGECSDCSHTEGRACLAIGAGDMGVATVGGQDDRLVRFCR
jgi:hypothetical protein